MEKRIPWNKGLKMSAEFIEKNRLGHIGKTVWNKGIKIDKEKYPNIGHHKPHSEETKKALSDKLKLIAKPNKTSFKKGQLSEENNVNWKGDNVSYRNLHRWVERKLGKAIKCVKCGKSEGRIHWSNNDHLYKRNTEDWTQLCPKCHAEQNKVLRRLNGVNSVDILTDNAEDNTEPAR
jgi:hypothetical protein